MILRLTEIQKLKESQEVALEEVLESLSSRMKEEGDAKLAQIADLLTKIMKNRFIFSDFSQNIN